MKISCCQKKKADSAAGRNGRKTWRKRFWISKENRSIQNNECRTGNFRCEAETLPRRCGDGDCLSNDKLNTIGIVTMQMLMQASKEPTWKQYIEDLDLTVIGETEVLEAAGIDPETPSYEEVETNEFIARFFWGLIQKKSRIFVLGDTGEELQTLQKYLTETYPGIEIGGGAVVETLEESAFDSLVNEINSQTTDVIVSGLAGTRQDRFVLENSSKISAKIWLSLGEHSTLQNEAGIKTSWWGTLLKKNTFKRMVTKYNSEKDG